MTTSTLTRDGKDHIADENLRAAHRQGGKEMHMIDAQRLGELLRAHPVAIEKAWKDILAKHAEKQQEHLLETSHH